MLASENPGWFRLKSQADGTLEVIIFGEVGSEVRATEIAAKLSASDAKEIVVRINSPGGEIYEGIAIMNALRQHPAHVTTVVESLAASIASVIAIGGGDRVVCRPHAEIMIHLPWTGIVGHAGDFQRAIADLDRVAGSLSDVYAAKSGGTSDYWLEKMTQETWYSADEALESGLIDAVEDARKGSKELAGSFNLSRFKYPGRASAPAPQIPSAREGRKGEAMSFLNDVALKLGVKNDSDEEMILAALDEVLAEQSENPGAGELPAKVEIAYPTGSTVVPTGTVTISPEGETPADVTFSVADAPDGWTAEIDENSGSLTVTAPDGAAVDDEVELTVTAETADGESTDLVVKVTVASASDSGDDSKTPADPPAPGDGLTTTVDSARLAELEALAEYGRKAKERDVSAQAKKFAADAVAADKIGNAAADRWAEAWLNDRVDAEARMAQIKAGTVHRAESGHAKSESDHSNADGFTDREAKAAGIIHGRKG